MVPTLRSIKLSAARRRALPGCRGGSARVLRARHRRTGERVVFKVPLAHTARLQAEVALLQRWAHPAIEPCPSHTTHTQCAVKPPAPPQGARARRVGFSHPPAAIRYRPSSLSATLPQPSTPSSMCSPSGGAAVAIASGPRTDAGARSDRPRGARCRGALILKIDGFGV